MSNNHHDNHSNQIDHDLNQFHTNLLQLEQHTLRKKDTLFSFQESYVIELKEKIDQKKQRLTSFGIDPTTLSSTTNKYLSILVELGFLLKLNSVQLSSYQCAITDQFIQAHEKWQSKYNQILLLEEQKEIHSKLTNSMANLEKSLEHLSQQTLDKGPLEKAFEKDLIILKQKAMEYKALIQTMDHPLTQIHELVETVSKLELELAHHQKLLETYESIPPNRILIELELKKAKAELKKMVEEKEELLNSMAQKFA